MSLKIVIQFPAGVERLSPGTLHVENERGEVVFGPVAALGRADQATAAANNNPSRDPREPYGDTPTGAYLPVGFTLKADEGTYGPHGVIILDPVAGDAAQAKANGRSGLLIHAGDARQSNGELRATNGCVRLSNTAMANFIRVLSYFRTVENRTPNQCSVLDTSTPVTVTETVVPACDNAGGDPPPRFSIEPWSALRWVPESPGVIDAREFLDRVLLPTRPVQAPPLSSSGPPGRLPDPPPGGPVPRPPADPKPPRASPPPAPRPMPQPSPRPSPFDPGIPRGPPPRPSPPRPQPAPPRPSPPRPQPAPPRPSPPRPQPKPPRGSPPNPPGPRIPTPARGISITRPEDDPRVHELLREELDDREPS